ncbi:MAG: hypothetical protein ABI681_12010 [Gemmatimonadales bacterium]
MTSSPGDGPSEATPTAPRAIVAGHGSFPDGLVSAVHQISGRGEVFLAISNSGLSGGDIESRLQAEATESGIRVFFTDLPGGSATLAVRRMMRLDPELVLVTGTNLATLLDFVFQPAADPREAARLAADKGRAALCAYGGP